MNSIKIVCVTNYGCFAMSGNRIDNTVTKLQERTH